MDKTFLQDQNDNEYDEMKRDVSFPIKRKYFSRKKVPQKSKWITIDLENADETREVQNVETDPFQNKVTTELYFERNRNKCCLFIELIKVFSNGKTHHNFIGIRGKTK